MKENEKTHDLVLLNTSMKDDINNFRCIPVLRKCCIIHLVLSGKGMFECRGKRYSVCAGQFFFIFPDTLVSYYPDEDDGWKYCWVDFRGTEAAELFSYTSFDMDNPVTPVMGDELCNKFKNLCTEFNMPGMTPKIRAKGMLYSVMADFCALFPSGEKEGATGDLSAVAAEYIKNNYYKQELSVEAVADALSVNRISLYRAFKSKLGISPVKFINKVRLDCACEILTDTALPIKTVAYCVGFSDPLYFSKVFSAYIGIPPKEYRKNRP